MVHFEVEFGKYKSTRLFYFSTEAFSKLIGTKDASKYFLFRNNYDVDGKGDFYFFLKNKVFVIDATGKLKNKMDLPHLIPKNKYSLLVDEKGDFALYTDDSLTKFYVIDPKGKLIKEQDPVDGLGYQDLDKTRFSEGILFSEETGRIYLKENKNAKIGQRIFINEYKLDEEEKKFPWKFDFFIFEKIIAVDRYGNFYAEYWDLDSPEAKRNGQGRRLYKFNSDFHLLAAFDFADCRVDEENGNIYWIKNVADPTSGHLTALEFYKLEKLNDF